MSRHHDFVATCPRGAEACLAEELGQVMPQARFQELTGAVRWRGPLESAYRACLWSRVASRVLLVLGAGPARDADELYDGVRALNWLPHLDPTGSLAIDFVGVSETLRNSHFNALCVKDAIVDQLRERTGQRPDIELKRPALRVNVHLRQDYATVAIDLSGEALHQRGARRTGAAPLKTSLAAALLRMAGWPALAQAGVPLVDPMCGSGTLLLEAAAMALDRAPGLLRERAAWGFARWPQHAGRTWRALCHEAETRAEAAEDRPLDIRGFDSHRGVLKKADHNARVLELPIVFEERAAEDQTPPESAGPNPPHPRGLLVVNPPYGERLGEEDEAAEVYQMLGDILRRRFLGWQAWILAGSPRLAKRIGLKATRKIPVRNGPLDCRWVRIDIRDSAVARDRGPSDDQ